jgi:hypothetical protein
VKKGWTLTPLNSRDYEYVELYFHFPIHLHGVHMDTITKPNLTHLDAPKANSVATLRILAYLLSVALHVSVRGESSRTTVWGCSDWVRSDWAKMHSAEYKGKVNSVNSGANGAKSKATEENL